MPYCLRMTGVSDGFPTLGICCGVAACLRLATAATHRASRCASREKRPMLSKRAALMIAAVGSLIALWVLAESLYAPPPERPPLDQDADNQSQLVVPAVQVVAQIPHAGGVSAVAFTSDARLALTAGNDKTTKLWDVASGKMLRTFVGEVSAIAFSPDGRLALSAGGTDAIVKL